MGAILFRRLRWLPVVLLGVSIITFAFTYLSAEDPAMHIFWARYGQEMAPSEELLATHPSIAPRWAFHGVRDLAMESLYLHRDVSKYLRSVTGNPTQNPIRYANCGDE